MSFGRLGALGRGFGRLGGGGGASRAPAIRLSAAILAENSAESTAIGTLSVVNATGTASFTLVDSSSNKVKLAGANNVNVQAGATPSDYEATPTFTFEVSVSGVTPAISNATFTIFVTDVAEGGNAPSMQFDDELNSQLLAVLEDF